MKEAMFYGKLENNRVKCGLCHHFCQINPGRRGLCAVRENQAGKLISLVYGLVIAAHVDPIEKKPLYHFLPKTQTLSIATVGCNFKCMACQNWQISQVEQGQTLLNFEQGLPLLISPAEVVKMALKSSCPSISYTYTEPTVFLEYALDTMKLAKKAELKNIWVSNGFLSKEAFDLILPYLDATNIDLKSFDENFYQKICGARLQPVLDNLKRLKANKVHLEITTLVIPTLNDSPEIFEKIAEFIKNELDCDTPWHISRFSPEISWKLQHLPPTPLSDLQTAYKIAKQQGLKNVHLGNV